MNKPATNNVAAVTITVYDRRYMLRKTAVTVQDSSRLAGVLRAMGQTYGGSNWLWKVSAN